MFPLSTRGYLEELVKGQDSGFAAFPAYKDVSVGYLVANKELRITHLSAPRGRQEDPGGTCRPRPGRCKLYHNLYGHTSEPCLLVPNACNEGGI
jgi:hypothetical protein